MPKLSPRIPIQLPNGQVGYVQRNRDHLSSGNKNNDNIYLILQFFIHQDERRNKELKYCLKQNVNLGLFAKIYLLNERIYSQEETGLTADEFRKIKQINIGRRLRFINVFQRTKDLNLKGYVVFCNSDMFFDKTLLNVRRSVLSTESSLYALLRFDYNGQSKLSQCKLFGPRYDSQDTWIFHTNFLPTKSIWKHTDFEFGRPGCDNRIIFVLDKHGYTCYNEPWNIKTYHYHTSAIRNYSVHDLVPGPYLALVPTLGYSCSFDKGIFGSLRDRI